jgi:hypothetical protein
MAVAKELMEAGKAADQANMLLPLLFQQLKPVIVQGRPNVERDYDKIAPVLMEAFTQQTQAMLDEIAAIYARNFTVEEKRQLATFYRSPAGQKFIEKMPVIAQQSMAAGQKIGQKIAQDLQARIMEELRKRGHNI